MTSCSKIQGLICPFLAPDCFNCNVSPGIQGKVTGEAPFIWIPHGAAVEEKPPKRKVKCPKCGEEIEV